MLSLSLQSVPSVPTPESSYALVMELLGRLSTVEAFGGRVLTANSEQPRTAVSLLSRGRPIIISGSSGYAISDTSEELRWQRRDGRGRVDGVPEFSIKGALALVR